MFWCGNRSWRVAPLIALLAPCIVALEVDPTSDDSIKAAAKSIAKDLMGYYVGNQPGQTPGYLPGNGPGGYYWWEAGGMFGTMVNYWYHTGDTTWVNETIQAITWQSDPSSGGYFASPNISAQLGNDDQAFWAFTALQAAEYKFPNPPSPYPSWLGMAQGVFNQQFQRWDNETCNGGLRWQVDFANAGWDYKNSISNGCFFNLAARLGKYTQNATYVEAAVQWWNWSVAEGLVIPDQGYRIIDGIETETCLASNPTHLTQWTYNVGVYLYGAAAMWNITQNNPQFASQADIWQQRTQGLLDGMEVFFLNDTTGAGSVLTEVVCEPETDCSNDAKSFKAYAARWMRVTALVAPFTASQVSSMLEASIQGAATACSGAGQAGGTSCGEKWYQNRFDGIIGVGQDMAALEVIQTLIEVPGPVTHVQGDSVSDPGAGGASTYGGNKTPENIIHVTKSDKAGAWFIFALLTGATFGGGFWAVK